MVAKNTNYDVVELQTISKVKSWKKIYQDSLEVWDLEQSDHEHLTYEGKWAKHKLKYNLATVFTKKSFPSGEKNLVFTFEFHVNQSDNYAVGVNEHKGT